MAPILVTGATGNVGREVVRLLIAQACEVRVAVRDRARIQQLFGHPIDSVTFDFTAPETFPAAFAGSSKLFLVRPPAIANVRQYMAPALQAAQQAGVEQIVFLSLLGADRNRVVPHYAIERTIEKLGIPATFLTVTDAVSRLLQRSPIRLEQYIEDYRSSWL